jgi:hypothetical protein
MVVKSADYGDFDINGFFNDGKNINSQCSKLTNCQVKSLCSGSRSCELTMDNKLLPLRYCSDISKQIYIKYTCMDKYKHTTKTSGKAKCINVILYYPCTCIVSKIVALRIRRTRYLKFAQKSSSSF